MVDDRFRFKSLKDSDFELFNSHKTIIDREIRTKFPSVPANFELKPVLVRHIEACGMIHNFKIALPENKFVKISITQGGYQVVKPGDDPKPPQPRITVDDTLTSTADE